jgi:hypothetical protein
MDTRKLVFIGGLHRSGTTILFRSLREHPQISGFRDTTSPKDEGQHLQTVYQPARSYGGAGLFGFHDAAYLDESSPLVSEENRQKLLHEWRPYWDLSRPVLLEKSLPNLIRSRFLQALFPESYFIILTRHPIATTLATKKWRPRQLLPQLFEHWFICYERLQADRKHVKNVFMLQYEQFVNAPEVILKQICNFLDILPMPPLSQEVRQTTNDKYFCDWQKMEKNFIMRYYVRYMVNRFEERANQFGYSFKQLPGQPTPILENSFALKGR